MAITFVNNSSPVAVTTTGSPAYPASLAAGDLIVLWMSSDVTGLASTAAISAGFTVLVAPTTGGSLTTAAWVKTATGSETGTIAVTATSGTKGVSFMAAYRPDTGYTMAATSTIGTDSTADASFLATGSSWSTATGDWVACFLMHITPTGTYSGNDTNVLNNLSQSGATFTDTPRLLGRSGTNTLYYNFNDAAVSAGGTGAPSWGTSTVATATGATATGQALFVKLAQSITAGSSSIAWTHTITQG